MSSNRIGTTPIDRARHAAAEKLHETLYGDTDGLYGNATFAANAALDAFLAKLAEDGMVVVPRVATREMCEAGRRIEEPMPTDTYHRMYCGEVWSAMIAATSPPPPEGQG